MWKKDLKSAKIKFFCHFIDQQVQPNLNQCLYYIISSTFIYFINIHTLQHIRITFPWCIKHKYTTPRRFATCPLVHTPRAPHRACVRRLSFARVCGSPAEDPQQSTLAPQTPKLLKLLKLLKLIKFIVILVIVVVIQYTQLTPNDLSNEFFLDQL